MSDLGHTEQITSSLHLRCLSYVNVYLWHKVLLRVGLLLVRRRSLFLIMRARFNSPLFLLAVLHVHFNVILALGPVEKFLLEFQAVVLFYLQFKYALAYVIYSLVKQVTQTRKDASRLDVELCQFWTIFGLMLLVDVLQSLSMLLDLLFKLFYAYEVIVVIVAARSLVILFFFLLFLVLLARSQAFISPLLIYLIFLILEYLHLIQHFSDGFSSPCIIPFFVPFNNLLANLTGSLLIDLLHVIGLLLFSHPFSLLLNVLELLDLPHLLLHQFSVPIIFLHFRLLFLCSLNGLLLLKLFLFTLAWSFWLVISWVSTSLFEEAGFGM